VLPLVAVASWSFDSVVVVVLGEVLRAAACLGRALFCQASHSIFEHWAYVYLTIQASRSLSLPIILSPFPLLTMLCLVSTIAVAIVAVLITLGAFMMSAAIAILCKSYDYDRFQ